MAHPCQHPSRSAKGFRGPGVEVEGAPRSSTAVGGVVAHGDCDTASGRVARAAPGLEVVVAVTGSGGVPTAVDGVDVQVVAAGMAA